MYYNFYVDAMNSNSVRHNDDLNQRHLHYKAWV